MLEPDLIQLFVEPLDRQGIRYLVTGSVAAMLYGEPRVTHDVDLVVFLREQDVISLAHLFPSPEFYVPPVEVITQEMSRTHHGQFNVIHVPSALKADFHPAGRDAFHAWAFRHARQYAVGGQEVCLAPPEYVIVRKLEYFREGGAGKHLRDIRAMLAVSAGQLDAESLQAWIVRQGLEAEWELVQSGSS